MLGVSGAAPEKSFRCLLLPNAVGLQAPKPTLALDVSNDAIRLVDPSDNAPVASAWRSQITASRQCTGRTTALVSRCPSWLWVLPVGNLWPSEVPKPGLGAARCPRRHLGMWSPMRTGPCWWTSSAWARS